MSNHLRAALIGAAVLASSSAVLALDGDANPVPNNAAYDQDSYIYSYAAPQSRSWAPVRRDGRSVRAPMASTRPAFNREHGIR
jgi:hypothetical protein